MTAAEVKELTNKFIGLHHEAEYEEAPDSFRAFWRGFDCAVELALKAMGEMVRENDVINDLKHAEHEEPVTQTYIRSQRRLDKRVHDFMM